MIWSQNDKLFIEELRQGYAWQLYVASFFKLHSIDVEVPPLTIRDNIKNAHNWLDSKDIKLSNGKQLEIKSRNEAFTSPGSFPYDTIFVDTVSGFEAKIDKPIAYIMVSRSTGCMLYLPIEKEYWTVEEKYDNTRHIKDKFYMAPKMALRPLNELVSEIKKIHVPVA